MMTTQDNETKIIHCVCHATLRKLTISQGRLKLEHRQQTLKTMTQDHKYIFCCDIKISFNKQGSPNQVKWAKFSPYIS